MKKQYSIFLSLLSGLLFPVLFITHVQGQGCISPSFGVVGNYAAGANPSAVATGDLNRDGKADMAVANTGSGSVSILINSCNVSFGAPLNS
ncbi:MAG: FG-GAP repeat protein [Ferruginibacter sp.]